MSGGGHRAKMFFACPKNQRAKKKNEKKNGFSEIKIYKKSLDHPPPEIWGVVSL